MYNCNDYDLVTFVKGELPHDTSEITSDHLAICAHCSKECEEIRAILDLLTEIESITPSRNFSAAVANNVKLCSESDILSLLNVRMPRKEALKLMDHIRNCEHCHTKLVNIKYTQSVLRKLKPINPSDDFVDSTVERAILIEKARQTYSFGLLARMFQTVKAKAVAASFLFSITVHVILFTMLALIIFLEHKPHVSEVFFISSDKKEFANIKNTLIEPDIKHSSSKSIRQYEPEISETKLASTSLESFPSPFKSTLSPSVMNSNLFRHQQYVNHAKLGKERDYSANENVIKALEWLESNQSRDGSWDVSVHGGKKEYKIGITALSIMSFLAQGSHNKGGKFREIVEKGIEFLLKNQDDSGLFGAKQGNYMYNHAIASNAIGDCYLLSRDQALVEPLKKAIDLILTSQREDGGWGYTIDAITSDTSVICFQVMALRTACTAGLTGSKMTNALKKAKSRIVQLTDENGLVGYREKGQYPLGSNTLTAMGALSFTLSSAVKDNEMSEKYKNVILSNKEMLTSDPNKNDLLFIYFSSLVLFQLQDPAFNDWLKNVNQKIGGLQKKDGSWAIPMDKWFSNGGDIYTTAIIILIIQSPTRYPLLLI